MNGIADLNNSYEGNLENATASHNVEANDYVMEGKTSHSSTFTRKNEKMDQKKKNKQNEGKTNPHDGEEKHNNITNELLINHDEVATSNTQNMNITHRVKKDSVVEKRRETLSISSSRAIFLKKEKKYMLGCHFTKEKCQENIEKINEKINYTMKKILKLYNDSNKKQYLSRLFQMKDISCLFSCMFFCLLIIFSIMNEYVGVLLSILLLIISIQLKFSRSNMALLNSIVAILFISIATAYSFSNIKLENIHDKTITRIDSSNASTNRRLLILEMVICLAYASILFIYMLSLRSVKRCKEKHVWIYHHIVTLFNFLDVCILFTFGVLAFFFIFICLGETLFIIMSFILFSTSVLTYSLRKKSSIGTLIFQTISIITNSIVASTYLSKNTATEKLAELPPDELGQLTNSIFLFYMIFLIFFLVLHLLYIFYIFFSHKNFLSKCFSQRSVYYSSVFPHPASVADDESGDVPNCSANGQSDESRTLNKKYDGYSSGNLPNKGEIHFVREKYLLSLDDDNKILNIQRRSCKQVHIDMGKYTYNELHLYKHLLLNTLVELKRSRWRRRGRGNASRGARNRDRTGIKDKAKRRKATHKKTKQGKLSMDGTKRLKRVQRLKSPQCQGNRQTEDFVLSINEESSEYQTNHYNTDEGPNTQANKRQCRRKNKKGEHSCVHFLLKNLSLVQKERSRNKVGPKKPLQNHHLYLTHCENDIYSPSSLFYSKYTYIIDVLLENYDELIFYLDRKKFFFKLCELAEKENRTTDSERISCQNCAREGDILKRGSTVNSNALLQKSSMNDSSSPLSDPTLEIITESPSLHQEYSESSPVKDGSISPSEEKSPNYMHRNWTEQPRSNIHLTNEYGEENEGQSIKAQGDTGGLITGASKWTDILNRTEDELNECYSRFMLNAEGKATKERTNSLFSNLNNDYMNIPVFSSTFNSFNSNSLTSNSHTTDTDNKKAENYFWYYSPGIIGRVYKEWLKCKNLDYKKMNNDFYYLFANSNKLHEFIKSNHSTLERQEEIKLFDISQVLSSNNSILNSIQKSFSSLKTSHLFSDEVPNHSSLNRIINTFLMDTNSDIEKLCMVDCKKVHSFLEDTNINKFLSSLYDHKGNEFTQGEMDYFSPSRLTPDLIEQLNLIVGEKKSEDGTQMKDYSSHVMGKVPPYDALWDHDINDLNDAPRKERQLLLQDNINGVINLSTSHLQKEHEENFDLNDLLNYAESLILQNKQNEAIKESELLGTGNTGSTENTEVQMQSDSDADSTDIKHFDEILSNFIKNFVSTRDSKVTHSTPEQSEHKNNDKMNSLKNIEEIYSNIKKTICDEEASRAVTSRASVKKNGESLAEQIIHTKKKEIYLKKRNVKNEQNLSNELQRREDSNGRNKLNKSLATGRTEHQLRNLNIVKNKSKGSIECLRKKGKKDTNQWTYNTFNEYINNDLNLEKKKNKIDSKAVPGRINSVSSDDVRANIKFTLICSSSEENVKDQKRGKKKILDEKKIHVEDTHLGETQNWGNISEGFLPAYGIHGGYAQTKDNKFLSSQKGLSSKLNRVKLEREKKNKPKQRIDGKSKESTRSSVSSTHEGGISNAERRNESYHCLHDKEMNDGPIGNRMHSSNNYIVDDRENSNFKDYTKKSLLEDNKKWKGKNEKCNETEEMKWDIANNTEKGILLNGNELHSSVAASILKCPLSQTEGNSKYSHEETQKSLKMENYHLGENKETPSNERKEKGNTKWNHHMVSVNVSRADSLSPVNEYCIHSNRVSYNNSSNLDSPQTCERPGEGDQYGGAYRKGEFAYVSSCPKNGEEKSDDSYKFSNEQKTSSNFNLDTHDLIKDLKKYLCSPPNSVDLEDSNLNDTFLLEFINKYLENSNPCEVSVYNEVVFDEASVKKDRHQVSTVQNHEQRDGTVMRNAKERKTQYYHLYGDKKKWQREQDKKLSGALSHNFYDEHIVNFLNTYMFENSDRLMKNSILKDKEESNMKLEKYTGKARLPLDAQSAIVYKKDEKEGGFLEFKYASTHGNDNHYDGKGKFHIDFHDKQEKTKNKEENFTPKGTHLKKKQNDTHLEGSNFHEKEKNKYFYNDDQISITGEYAPWKHDEKNTYIYKDRNKEGNLSSHKRENMFEELIISKGKEDKVEEQSQKNVGENEMKKTSSDIFYSISNLESLKVDEPLAHLGGRMNSNNLHAGEEKEKEKIIKKADLNLVLQSSGSEKQSDRASSSDEGNYANGVEDLPKEHPLHIHKPNVNIFDQAYGFESKLSDVLSSSGIKPSGIEPSVIKPSVIEPSGIEPSGIKPSVIKPSVLEPSGIEPAGLLVGSDALYESFAYKSFENIDHLKRRTHELSSKKAKDDASGDLDEQKASVIVNVAMDESNSKGRIEILRYSDLVKGGSDNRSSCGEDTKEGQGQSPSVSLPISNHSTVHDVGKMKKEYDYFTGKDAISSGKKKELKKVQPNPSKGQMGSTQVDEEIGKEKNYLKNNFTNYEIYESSKISGKDANSGGTDDRTGISARDPSNNQVSKQMEMNLFNKIPPSQEEKIIQSKRNTKLGKDSLGDSYKNINHVDALQVDHNIVTKMMTYDEPEAGEIPLPCTYGGKIHKNVGGAQSNSFLSGEISSSMGRKNLMDSQNVSSANHINDRNKSGFANSVIGAQQSMSQTNEQKKARSNSYKHHFLGRGTGVIIGPGGGKDTSNGGERKKDEAEKVHAGEVIEAIEGDIDEDDEDDFSEQFSSKSKIRKSRRPPRSNTKLTLTEKISVRLGNSQSTESDLEEKKGTREKWNLGSSKRYKEGNDLSAGRKKKENYTTLRGYMTKKRDHIFDNSDYIKHFNSIIKTYSWSPENLRIGENNYSLKKYKTCIDTASTEDSDDASKMTYFVKDVLGENSNSISSSSGYEEVDTRKYKKEFSREAKLHHPLKLRKEKRSEYKHKEVHGDVIQCIKTDTQESFIELIEQGNIFPTIRCSRDGGGALHRSLPSNGYNSFVKKGGMLSTRGTSNYSPSSNHSNFSHSSDQGEIPQKINTQTYVMNERKEASKVRSVSENGINMEDIKVFTDDGYNDEYNFFYNWNEVNNEVNYQMNKTENYKKIYSLKKKGNSVRLFKGNLNNSRRKLHLSEDLYADGGNLRVKGNNSNSPFYNNTKRMRRSVTIGDSNSSNFYRLEKRGKKNASSSVNALGEDTARRRSTVKLANSAYDSTYEMKNSLAKREHTKNNNSSIISFNEEKFAPKDMTITKIMPHYESLHINSNFSFESKYTGNLWKKMKRGTVVERTNLEDSTAIDSLRGKYHTNHDNYSNGGVNTGRKNNSKGRVMKSALSKRKKSLTGGQSDTNYLASYLSQDSQKNFVHELKKKLATKNAQGKNSQMGSNKNNNGENQMSKKKTYIDPQKLTSAIRNFRNYKKMSRENMKAVQVKLPPKNREAKNYRPLKLRYSVDNFYNVINSEDDANEDMFIHRHDK
ncbi:conserved Plasmodium protein, unknown function [Plasmodium knowlesi strain H]|uniref:Basal complex transmembrane protein 2 n=3 Tax=Plasmodium knowlesi TaxID=5850 RepID=A0A5K1V5F2_PLAKH|nr:basal complex transmembrane protein 2, putative [Plasmodium knowlesi strain H]OTN68682.1 Uncharacterized protein PKNOH_S01010600 [Plasmodium knowlesi]CAA9986107.1 basal complex transmembrane protein 2, putative [Plasmodium knowlesi strain H]SBO25268.1 conserved Plasmodium protein, unknown function [Plasmodium knowlesi strain H]SBO27603.1 conserved Plasmodium protein, unknown function [Plasmodium knowlesi strain H]VVS75581.1 basal complex transmembrane protein 2, putative [Plasmodium knowles|eukprot:XP_002257518.1 hypothetical protein, conserved in Plasmodium species [Plasmodium knowlesi strain H]